MKCKLCRGTGDNLTGIEMKVNNHICPRCGGYGTIPENCENSKSLDKQDYKFINCNGKL